MSDLKFPDGFLWGAATAAHQVEGANDNNDWWDWEQTSGRIDNGDRSGSACDWFKGERYREDFDLAKKFCHNAHRLSIEWSRIEPSEGQWSADAIAYYRRVLTALRDRGLMPMVTLHHFSNPRWLRDAPRGAWETQSVVSLFERFATKVVQELGDLCDFWVTINEPIVYAYASYIDANWPPGKKDFGLGMNVVVNLLRGHAAAFRAIHRVQPNARVGIAHHIRVLKPQNPQSWLNCKIAAMQHRVFNQVVLYALQDGRLRFPLGSGSIPELVDTQDFIGLNYYFSSRVAIDVTKPMTLFGRQMPAKPWGVSYENDLRKWFGRGDLDPEALYETAKWMAQFGKPIYVAENGICDPTDELRPRYLVTHLAQLQRANQEGVPIKGYFHWSLTDNFEWKEGWGLKFGLIANDFQTQKRTPRPSAGIYARIIRENGIAGDLMDKYGRL
ncbi:MAG: glycoside hydrolase family 1 protein [Chloroflexi bacterium]|nr:glycoside hydrolase family 1 protein [Chloroflexota bacterium]